METYLLIAINSQTTHVTSPYEIVADQVAVVSTQSAPNNFILLTSDIAEFQVFKDTVKPIIGRLPSADNCYRPLSRTRFTEFVINLEDYSGEGFTPDAEFLLEIKFRNGSQ